MEVVRNLLVEAGGDGVAGRPGYRERRLELPVIYETNTTARCRHTPLPPAMISAAARSKKMAKMYLATVRAVSVNATENFKLMFRTRTTVIVEQTSPMISLNILWASQLPTHFTSKNQVRQLLIISCQLLADTIRSISAWLARYGFRRTLAALSQYLLFAITTRKSSRPALNSSSPNLDHSRPQISCCYANTVSFYLECLA